MGDRRMAEIRTARGSLYVYTHWDGEIFPEMAIAAVKVARPRWDDPSYATRILVDQLTKGGRDRETGYGLLLSPDAEDTYNGDQPSIIIDLIVQKVTIIEAGEQTWESVFEDL